MNLPKNMSLTQMVPSEFFLSQNYPNPFTERTAIKFCVPCRTKVKLEVFDSDGRIIERLLDDEMEAGTYRVEFSAKHARNLTQGIYVCRLQAEGFSASKEMLLLREEVSPYKPSRG